MNNSRKTSSPSWADLNAYVDGELERDEAAAVAAAIAADSQLAQEVARLTRLKWAVSSQAEQASVMPLPPRPPQFWRPLLAASIALLILAGGAWSAYRQLQPAAIDAPAALLTAVRLHAQWTDGSTDSKPPEASGLLAAAHDFGHPLLLPDLSDNQLRVASVGSSGSLGEILHIGYSGTRGCQVSLLAFRDAEMSADLRQVAHGRDTAYLWKVDRIGFVLLADGMSDERLSIIARAAEEATRSGSRISPETRTALADSRARSEACLG